MPSLPDENQPHTAAMLRRVLTEDEYQDVHDAARGELGTLARHIGTANVTATVCAVLAAVGILAPPPEPEDDQCPAQFADPDGYWHQCTEDPGHPPTDGHSDGEWSWPDGDTQAIPELVEPAEDDVEAQQ
ncbi:hypothetical protein [Streptomyces sp. NPDC054962]